MATLSRRLPFPTLGSPRQIQPFHLLLMSALSLAAVVWGAIVISGRHGYELEGFLVILGVFTIASIVFIFSRAETGPFRFFDLPVYLTILGLVCFGLAPLRSFMGSTQRLLDPSGETSSLVRGIVYFGLGMLAFWLGCSCTSRRRSASCEQGAPITTSHCAPNGVKPSAWALVLFVISVAGRVYLLQAGAYYYTGMRDALSPERLSLIQAFDVLGQLGLVALIVISIEKFVHPLDQGLKLLFVIIFASECGWGLISGMKIILLQNFIVVALVASMIQRRFRSSWVAAALLGLIVLYPLSNAYRGLIRGQGAIQVTSLSAATGVTQMAFEKATWATGGPRGWIQSGLDRGLARLDLLQSLATVVSLSATSAQRLEGTEHLWMIPYYPFIPRFLWPTKPVLDKGRRFSVVLKSGGQTSTAITYPGDLYLQFGLPGILIGMFLLGVVAQIFANTVSGPTSTRGLFIYAAMFQTATCLEADTFSYWSSLIKTLAIVVVLAWVIYGPAIKPTARRQDRRRVGCLT